MSLDKFKNDLTREEEKLRQMIPKSYQRTEEEEGGEKEEGEGGEEKGGGEEEGGGEREEGGGERGRRRRCTCKGTGGK